MSPPGREKAYRFIVFGDPRGPWRATRQQAWADAIDEGLGEFDDYTDRVWITVPGEIWVTEEEVDTVAREPARRRRPATLPPPKFGPTSADGPSRIERIIARREGALPPRSARAA